MEVEIVRHFAGEEQPHSFPISPAVVTVGDLMTALEKQLGLDSHFSLAFVHRKSHPLSEIGLVSGSTISVTDRSARLLLSLDDLNNEDDGFVAVPDEPAAPAVRTQMPVAKLSENVSSDGIKCSELLSSTTNLNRIPEDVFPENITWFDAANMIGKVEYEKEDLYKKIVAPKIKIRVLFGNFSVEVKKSDDAISTRTNWVAGADVCLDAFDSIYDLRNVIEKESVLLPPMFTFFTLSHTKLDENLTLYENGIKDGDVILLCSERVWKVKVFLSLEGASLEASDVITVSPSSTVGQLKKMVRKSVLGSYLSGLEDFSAICEGVVLDETRSLECQIAEEQVVHIRG
ncbi:uncharacterized protein LOC126799417 [Argentina anserina]|uniref:uncharacterized protein LOC126799417 n=1 Tax=Argentina anserina TaxID=57926 RepID=UPI0021763A94|nr:uncharacterized protein LOC126799417 [Potentilla anserina]